MVIYAVRIFVKQVRVNVERHRRFGVAKHPLNRLHIGVRTDCQAGRCVTEVVRGHNAAEVMTTIRELGERGIVLRSLREGIDTSNVTGRMVADVLASLAELELKLGKER